MLFQFNPSTWILFSANIRFMWIFLFHRKWASRQRISDMGGHMLTKTPVFSGCWGSQTANSIVLLANFGGFECVIKPTEIVARNALHQRRLVCGSGLVMCPASRSFLKRYRFFMAFSTYFWVMSKTSPSTGPQRESHQDVALKNRFEKTLKANSVWLDNS